MFAQDYVASQIYTVAVRITKYTSVSSVPVVCFEVYFEVHRTFFLSEVFLDNNKMKNIVSGLFCPSHNFGEVYNIVLLINNCDLFILLEMFLANERHLLLPVSSPMQTRLF